MISPSSAVGDDLQDVTSRSFFLVAKERMLERMFEKKSKGQSVIGLWPNSVSENLRPNNFKNFLRAILELWLMPNLANKNEVYVAYSTDL